MVILTKEDAVRTTVRIHHTCSGTNKACACNIYLHIVHLWCVTYVHWHKCAYQSCMQVCIPNFVVDNVLVKCARYMHVHMYPHTQVSLNSAVLYIHVNI